MKKTPIVLALGICLLVLRSGSFAAPLALLHFGEHGFSIAPLAGHSDAATQQVVTMMQPAKDGFGSNVNVQVQPYPDTVAAYIALSKGQFDQMKVKMLSSKQLDASTFVMEYAGPFNGVEMHGYARGVKKDAKIYLATGMTTTALWATAGAALKACVDSLRAD